MAVRQITPVEKVVKCHVNSLDGSPVYESGVAYEAGTLVIYNDMPYVSVVPIEDSDADTPDEAPAKWSITPDAFTASASESGLANRVATLEDEMDTAQTDILDLQSHGNVIIDNVSVTVEAGKTLVEAVTSLGDAALAYIEALEDDEVVIPFLYNLPIAANGSMLAFHSIESDRYNTQTAARFDASETRCSSSETNIDTYCVRFGDSSVTLQSIQKYSSSTQTTSVLSSTVLTTNCSPFMRFLRFKKIT